VLGALLVQFLRISVSKREIYAKEWDSSSIFSQVPHWKSQSGEYVWTCWGPGHGVFSDQEHLQRNTTWYGHAQNCFEKWWIWFRKVSTPDAVRCLQHRENEENSTSGIAGACGENRRSEYDLQLNLLFILKLIKMFHYLDTCHCRFKRWLSCGTTHYEIS